MITALIHAAHRLDLWLQATLGRPYNVLLSVGLITEIVRGTQETLAHRIDPGRLVETGLVITMNLALLIHQVGALSHRLEARRAHREKRRSDRP